MSAENTIFVPVNISIGDYNTGMLDVILCPDNRDFRIIQLLGILCCCLLLLLLLNTDNRFFHKSETGSTLLKIFCYQIFSCKF